MILVHISLVLVYSFLVTLLFFLCDFFFLETCFKTKICSTTPVRFVKKKKKFEPKFGSNKPGFVPQFVFFCS